MRVVNKNAESLTRNGKPSYLGVSGSDPLVVVTAAAVSFITGISVEIPSAQLKIDSSCPAVISQISSSGDPESDLQVKINDGDSFSWQPQEPSVSILFPEDLRVVYPLKELWNAAESFIAFTDLKTQKGIAVTGSPTREFEFFLAVSALVAGVPLAFFTEIQELDQISETQVSAAFFGRDVTEKQDKISVDGYARVLRPRRRSFSLLGVEGPLSAEFTKSLEKACDIPVLQMFGISGRGIILCNPLEFNVHGSAGIPITNSEAIMADNLEGNWARDRILIAPGSDGELVIRGDFVDAMKDVGDPRQNPVKTSIEGQSTEWLATGIMGKMDENGYFYLKDASFR